MRRIATILFIMLFVPVSMAFAQSNKSKIELSKYASEDYTFYYPSSYIKHIGESGSLVYKSKTENPLGGMNNISLKIEQPPEEVEKPGEKECQELADTIRTVINEYIDDQTSDIQRVSTIDTSNHYGCYMELKIAYEEGVKFMSVNKVMFGIDGKYMYTLNATYDMGTSDKEVGEIRDALDKFSVNNYELL